MSRHFNLLIVSMTLTVGIFGAMVIVESFARADSFYSINSIIFVNTTDDELNSDGDCSLREAINAANTNTATDACLAGDSVITDTIDFIVNGTIWLTSTLDVISGGPLVIDGDGIIINHNGADGRILYVDSGSDLTLDGLFLAYGNTNSELGGGGIYNLGTLVLNNSTLSNNSAFVSGGGISNDGTLTVLNSTLSANAAFQHGGGIFNSNRLIIIGSRLVEGNNAIYNGGGINNSGILTITRTTISGNSVQFSGGGIYNSGTMSIMSSTLSGNRAALGGGISTNSATIINSTIDGNTASSDGGGINNGGLLKLFSSTISGNSAHNFGGGLRDAGDLTIKNTILANNTSTIDGPDCSASPVTNSEGFNLVGNTNGCYFIPTTGDLTSIDPRLGSLNNYGGPTYTRALLPDSPAIDAGNPDGCTDHLGNPLNFDQRGRARVGRCDIGAFEYYPLKYVSLPIILRNFNPDFFDIFSNPARGWPER